MIEVVSVGVLATIQDLGRPGHAHLGVPHSGAADQPSFLLANRLVGNVASAAVVELLAGGGVIRCHVSVDIAVTGAPVPVRVGPREVAMNDSTHVQAGQIVNLGSPTAGLRTYIAVAGGIDVPAVLGSRATDTLCGVGPPPLTAGQRLGLDAATSGVPAAPTDVVRPPVPDSAEFTVAYRRGPRDDWFTAASFETFEGAAWQVTAEVNRVGARLAGPALGYAEDRQLPTEGMVLGAVQVPASGQPIVFLADHPTVGGYPVIGVVNAVGVATMAQARPGQRVRFQRVP